MGGYSTLLNETNKTHRHTPLVVAVKEEKRSQTHELRLALCFLTDEVLGLLGGSTPLGFLTGVLRLLRYEGSKFIPRPVSATDLHQTAHRTPQHKRSLPATTDVRSLVSWCAPL